MNVFDEYVINRFMTLYERIEQSDSYHNADELHSRIIRNFRIDILALQRLL